MVCQQPRDDGFLLLYCLEVLLSCIALERISQVSSLGQIFPVPCVHAVEEVLAWAVSHSASSNLFLASYFTFPLTFTNWFCTHHSVGYQRQADCHLSSQISIASCWFLIFHVKFSFLHLYYMTKLDIKPSGMRQLCLIHCEGHVPLSSYHFYLTLFALRHRKLTRANCQPVVIHVQP